MTLWLAATAAAGSVGAADASKPAPPLAVRAHRVLTDALAEEKAFVKVHAAEALIALGETQPAHRVFLAELPGAAEVRPYRIGVWRVLAASSNPTSARAEWISRIEGVATDTSAMDQLHAMETLGKLGHAASGPVLAAARLMAAGPDAEAVFPRWVLHLAGDPRALPAIVAALESAEPAARLRAAYVLRRLNVNDAATRAALARTARREPPTSIGYAIILGSALALKADPSRSAAWNSALEEILANGSAGARYDACQILMQRYTTADIGRLAPLLDHPDGDARIGGAWAILHISRGNTSTASPPPVNAP